MLAMNGTPLARVPIDDDREGCARCWALIERAIRTHDSLPGDKLATLASGIEFIQEYTDERPTEPSRFRPTPRDISNMLPALAWLCWLRRQQGSGARDFKLLIRRARGVTWWKIAQHHGVSERQAMRWSDGAIAAIYSRHSKEIWERKLPGER